MGEAFNDVTLKLSLQVDGQRLEPLDTSRLDRSLADAERRIKASGAAAAVEYQRQLDAIRFPKVSFAGGGSVSAGVTTGPNDNLRLAPLPEERERLINRRQLAPESGGFRSAAQAAVESQVRLEAATVRATQAESTQSRVTEEAISRNIRLAGTLGKVSSSLAIAVVGYRALTQVNGEHVNILGKWESSLETGAVALAVAARGASTTAGLMTTLGVAAGTVAAGLGVITAAVAPFVVALYQARKEERESKIELLQWEAEGVRRSTARSRALAIETNELRIQADAEKRLAATQLDRLGRHLQEKREWIGATVDPNQRQAELASQLTRINAVIDVERRRQFDANEKLRTHEELTRRTRARGSYGGAGFAAAYDEVQSQREADAANKQRLQSEEKINRLISERQQLLTDIGTASREETQNLLRDLETIQRFEDAEDDARRRYAGLSRREQAIANRTGKYGVDPELKREADAARGRLPNGAALDTSTAVAAEITRIKELQKSNEAGLAREIKKAIGEESKQTDLLEAVRASAEARSEGQKELNQALVELNKTEVEQIKSLQRQVEDLGGQLRRRGAGSRNAGGAGGGW